MRPFHEEHTPRITAEELGLLAPTADLTFDQTTKFVRRLFRIPMCLLSVIDAPKNRQFFKNQVGLKKPWCGRQGTPLSHSFCQHVLLTCAPHRVDDAGLDEQVSCNLAIEDLDVIAHLGVPAFSADRETVAAPCAIDHVPRPWLSLEVELLEILAEGISAPLRARTGEWAGDRLLLNEAA